MDRVYSALGTEQKLTGCIVRQGQSRNGQGVQCARDRAEMERVYSALRTEQKWTGFIVR